MSAFGALQKPHPLRQIADDLVDVRCWQTHGSLPEAFNELIAALLFPRRPWRLLCPHPAVDLCPDAVVQGVEVGRTRWEAECLDLQLLLALLGILRMGFLLEQL